MKKVILVLMFCLPVFVSATYSQTKQESIKKLFKVMQQDSVVDKMFSSIIPTMMNQMRNQFPIKDSLRNARSNEMMKLTIQSVKEITKKKLNEDLVVIYDKYFTESEINDYITFYKSPSGQKFIKTTPEISKEIMKFMILIMQDHFLEIQKTIKDKAEEMKKADKK